MILRPTTRIRIKIVRRKRRTRKIRIITRTRRIKRIIIGIITRIRIRIILLVRPTLRHNHQCFSSARAACHEVFENF